MWDNSDECQILLLETLLSNLLSSNIKILHFAGSFNMYVGYGTRIHWYQYCFFSVLVLIYFLGLIFRFLFFHWWSLKIGFNPRPHMTAWQMFILPIINHKQPFWIHKIPLCSPSHVMQYRSISKLRVAHMPLWKRAAKNNDRNMPGDIMPHGTPQKPKKGESNFVPLI